MTQTDLFAITPLEPPIRRARKSDPASSHIAAEEIEETAESQCARILAHVVAHPNCTTRELHNLTGVPVHTLGRRLPELRAKGKVCNPWYGDTATGMQLRRCAIQNRLALTWRAV